MSKSLSELVLTRDNMRPGNHWVEYDNGVWENSENKIRVHMMARVIRLTNGDVRTLYQIPYAYDLWFLLQRVNGLNPKRALLSLVHVLLDNKIIK
jgi:hypothetical protein